VLETADIQKTYEELKAKGVEFLATPTERFYGIEALKDNRATGSACRNAPSPRLKTALAVKR